MFRIIHLVQKAKKGNNKAFLKLFQKYEEDIYRTALVYVKDSHDALDIVQETAYRSFKSISKLKEPKYFKTWLIRIAINCSLDFIQKQKKVTQMTPEYEDMMADNGIENIPLSLSLQALIEILSVQEKSVIILRFYHDYTLKEVSELLNKPLGSVKTILYRSLKKLRKEIKGDASIE